ncbi:hypothetical protein Pst134EA_025508 [Puccinia striiformis f. sp. tritici]|uniref:Uncharacterized protein n=1 Tax=Puccinia striiformis f. sp. tritici PST-78 TaxID=1165861 RepID=A0A0L0W0Q7_9BASI|nr:hypothetical protein Pst134EA_025508 [Puccinia striiformis f. sp. tritici]KAH9451561.1 hypothetical protein Pst134EA_025508 [Puccinia striiformis f. sp. tritici]KNF05094.1 hypothetical protein PSTG_01725 [Puccinia striiformis f. sp. tritici PST-78]
MGRDIALDSEPNPAVGAPLNGPVQASRLSYEKTQKMVPDWVHKVKIDMASMAFYHQVEGFFVIASLHPKGPIFKQGGSSFGNRYLNMIAAKNGRDARAEFHIWVAAQAIQIENGCQPMEIKQQRTKSVGDITDQFLANKVSDNVHEIRIKFKELIRIGSGNKLSCAWPGENCERKLKEMKLSLEIDENDWSLVPKDIMMPPEKLKNGMDRTVLACLSLNKIHLIYHPEWEVPPPGSKNPDKRKHSSKHVPKHNSSTRPAPNTSNSNASDRAAGAPNTSNSNASDRAAGAPNTADSNASDRAAGAPNTADSNASDCAAGAPNTSDSSAGAPNTSNSSASDRAAAAPDTTSSSARKKRKHPVPNTSKSTASDRAAAPNAPNPKAWNRASAARKARDSHFSKGAAAAGNNRDSTSLDGAAADGPDSNNNTSSRREPVPVLDPILEALGNGVAYL